MICPYCGSENTSPVEREYTHEYSFWIALAAVLVLLGGAFLLFLFLQLHPVILLLLVIAGASLLLDTGNRRRRKRTRTMQCLGRSGATRRELRCLINYLYKSRPISTLLQTYVGWALPTRCPSKMPNGGRCPPYNAIEPQHRS